MWRDYPPELRFKSDLSEHLFREYRKLLKATQWEQCAKIAHRYIFKGKPLQWCLGVQAFACTTWKRSTCCCLCQTEMFPLMYQFYHMDFPILLRAEHQHYCWTLHFGKGQLLDCQAKHLLVSFSNKTCWSCWPSKFSTSHQKEPSTLFDGLQNPHFATQLFIQKLGKKRQRTESNTARQVFLHSWLFSPSSLLNYQSISLNCSEDECGEVAVPWQLKCTGYAASNIHTWKAFKNRRQFIS